MRSPFASQNASVAQPTSRYPAGPLLNRPSRAAFVRTSVGLLPPSINDLRDRFDLVEALSGWDKNDVLRGDETEQRAIRVQQRQLLDLLRPHRGFRLGHVGVAGMRHKTIARRHARADRSAVIREPHIPRRQQSLDAALVIHDDRTADAGGASVHEHERDALLRERSGESFARELVVRAAAHDLAPKELGVGVVDDGLRRLVARGKARGQAANDVEHAPRAA